MSGNLEKEVEEALLKLGAIRCPKCNESNKIIFVKHLENIILLKCQHCSTSFYLSNNKVTEEELEYLSLLGFTLEPQVLLNKKKRVPYVS